MIVFGPVLMAASPVRPTDRVVVFDDAAPDDLQQHLPHLRHAEPDQLCAPFFRRGVRSAPDRITVATARAHRLRVTCRYHPSQLRTSYSSRPQSPLLNSKFSSMVQRRPATWTRSVSVVAGGAPQAK